jgi:predicted nucleotidyltransferase
MDTSEILLKLKNYKEKASNKYNVKRIGIFGSYARGEATETSDIDIVIELDAPELFKSVHIKKDLERLFAKHVDIIRKRKNMNPFLKKRIEKNVLYV